MQTSLRQSSEKHRRELYGLREDKMPCHDKTVQEIQGFEQASFVLVLLLSLCSGLCRVFVSL